MKVFDGIVFHLKKWSDDLAFLKGIQDTECDERSDTYNTVVSN